MAGTLVESKVYRGTWGEVLPQIRETSSTIEVEVKVFEPVEAPKNSRSIELLESWLADVPTDPEEIRLAEEELLEFKRNMNIPRKEAGARLHYPEVE